MPRYVAFLRGVSPLNCKMPALRQCFEAAGLADVRTLLSSGNVAFSARASSSSALEKKCERAMQLHLDRVFTTFVRPAAHLQAFIGADVHGDFNLAASAKPIVTFLHGPAPAGLALPIAREGATILKVVGQDVFSAYEPTGDGPAFMRLLERTFGADITTRTLDTVKRCAAA